MGCPVVCGRRDKEFIIASVSKRYQNLEKKSLFFVVGVGVLVASHFDTKIRCERFSKIEDKRITYQHLDLRDVYRTHSISLCVLSVPLSLSLCVCVCVRACVCAVLCVSLLLFDEFFVLFQASLVLIFLVDSSSLPISVSSSRTRERLPLFLFCSSRTSPRLSDDFPNDFPTTKGARVLACVLWCWCWCWYSARNEELMKIRARKTRCV